jgi:hypothetical protein
MDDISSDFYDNFYAKMFSGRGLTAFAKASTHRNLERTYLTQRRYLGGAIRL